MKSRTFGWIQNSANTASLKDVVKIFVYNSDVNKELREERISKFINDKSKMENFIKILSKKEVQIPYSALKNVIQVAIPGPGKKECISSWASDCFLRKAISLDFLNYDRETDLCSISEVGLEFAKTERNSVKEKECLGKVYLSYPPAVRVLSLLEEYRHLTKFEIGAKLGIIGEAGFTSIPQNIFLQGLCDAKKPNERKEIIQNVEGDSDKYARVICSWFIDIGWVKREAKIVTEKIGSTEYTEVIRDAFTITLAGKTELKKAYGISRVKKIPKIIYWEMLATKPEDRDYLRTRRAHIIQCLNTKSGKTIIEVCSYLKTKSLSEDEATIRDDIKSLENIGLTVKKTNDKYKITDTITHLDIPVSDKKIEKSNVTEIKNKIRNELKLIDHKYLNLIDLSFEGKNSSREFEIQTIALLTNELEFKGIKLGESNKPDGIIYRDSKGVIIDNKSYLNEYDLPKSEQDKMCRYIKENQERDKKINSTSWWNNFPKEVLDFSFLFVSSNFVREISKKLTLISFRTKTDGAAINSMNLLLLAERIKDERISYQKCFELFTSNSEIIVT